jgi:hypothetical protein
MGVLEEINQYVFESQFAQKIQELVKRIINEGYQSNQISRDCLVAGINATDQKWHHSEAFMTVFALA